MEIIKLREDYIKLGQALKAAGLAESGVEANLIIDHHHGYKDRVLTDCIAQFIQ